MPAPIPLPVPKRRGPQPPPPPGPPTEPRLEAYPLLPGEDGAAWARHAGEVLDGLAPADGLERKLAAAVTVGMWRELRADRIEAEVLADIAPRSQDRGHGSDLQPPAHAAALTAALRCQTAAAIATGRALRLFLAQRKARAAGLLGQDVADATAPARPRARANPTAPCARENPSAPWAPPSPRARLNPSRRHPPPKAPTPGSPAARSWRPIPATNPCAAPCSARSSTRFCAR